MAEQSRVGSGFSVFSERLEVLLRPNEDGLIGVRVLAMPALTGFDQACRVQSEGAPVEFGMDEISIAGDTLMCLRKIPEAPAFREGFVLDLDPGMAALIREALPKLGQVAELAKELHTQVQPHVQENGWNHLLSFLPEVAGHVVLDGCTTPEAIRRAAAHHFASKHADFMAALAE